MWQKYPTRILLGVLVLVLVGTALPMIAQDAPPPQPYVDPPSTGTWHGVAYFGPEGGQLAAPITFEVNGGSLADGRIRFDFQYEGMTQNLIDLMNVHGCTTAFQDITPGSNPVSGYFMDAERAVGTFATTICYLEGYGDLTFGAPITGVWYAELDGSPEVVFGVQPTATPEAAQTAQTEGTSMTITPETVAQAPEEPTPMDNADTQAAESTESGEGAPTAFGVEVYLDNCSECHGYFGEGGPGVADLTEPKVRRMTDEKLLEIINLGVEGTEMEPWGRILTEEEKQAVIAVIRQPEILRERYQ